jgi:hypothetical protein
MNLSDGSERTGSRTLVILERSLGEEGTPQRSKQTLIDVLKKRFSQASLPNIHEIFQNIVIIFCPE